MTESSTTESTSTPRTSVTATGPDPNASATESPAQRPPQIEHTPTLPQGALSNYAEPVTNTPVGTPLSVAPDPTQAPEPRELTARELAGALVSRAPGQIEIAAPAPLPRPGDEQLLRGTAAGMALQEKLTGEAPEMPGDPTSDEAHQAERDAVTAQMEAAKEAADEQEANYQLILDNQPKPEQQPTQ